jgi:hypothetical protein
VITTTCYLLHFDKPIGDLAKATGWAQHYLGSSADVYAELARLASPGCHAKIMREVNRLGIGWELVRTWPGGRVREAALKERGPGRYCPRCASPKSGWQIGDKMLGGYAVVAAVLNQRFAPHPAVTRSRVYHWDVRRTLNHAGQRPPEPVELRPDALRTQPRRVFDTEHWVIWFRAGIPTAHATGWAHWAEISPGTAGVPAGKGKRS